MRIRTYAAGVLAAALAVSVAIGGASSSAAATAPDTTIDACVLGPDNGLTPVSRPIVYLVPVGVTARIQAAPECTLMEYGPPYWNPVPSPDAFDATISSADLWVEVAGSGGLNILLYPCEASTVDGSRITGWNNTPTEDLRYWDAAFEGAVSLCSSGSGGGQAPPSRVLTFRVPDGSCSTSSSTSAADSSWVQLPGVDQCARAGEMLLGWATSPDFPVDVAKAQVGKGWGAIDDYFSGVRMIFIPAGGYAAVSGDNSLYPIWSR